MHSEWKYTHDNCIGTVVQLDIIILHLELAVQYFPISNIEASSGGKHSKQQQVSWPTLR